MNYKTMMLLGAIVAAATANAQVAVDGIRGTEWNGVSAAQVTHLTGTPESNFGAPTSLTNGADYDLYFRGDDTYLYGLVTVTGNQTSSAGNFANLYFDLDPQNNNGSDWGMEINGMNITATAFVAGGPSGYSLGNNVTVGSVTGGIEFALKWSYLEDGSNPDISYYKNIDGSGGPVLPGGKVVARLSQSFGYSVAGGATYGANRLGFAFAPANPTPEPSALAALGLGALAFVKRRRK